MNTVHLLTSTNREHGGKVIEGIFTSYDLANKTLTELYTEEPYWRIYFIEEITLDTRLN